MWGGGFIESARAVQYKEVDHNLWVQVDKFEKPEN